MKDSKNGREDYNEGFAKIYDMLSHKDYAGEVECLERLVLSDRCVSTDKIISVGCGTGIHEMLLAGHGFEVLGVDISNDMIEQAQSKLSAHTGSLRCKFEKKEISDCNEEGFSVAISLFNVINCLDDIQALCQFFAEIKEKLNEGGTLFFECWNGLACIIDPPKIVKREFDTLNFTRTASPTLDAINQKLVIDYSIHGDEDKCDVIESKHRLTLFSNMEIKFALDKAGFDLISIHTDLSTGMLAAQSSDRMLSFVCKKRHA
jgi:2-polyprenyl-3-methyl-5-hydroxy-6-metoxy-1,4-benzoquinol methylase